MHTNPRLTDSFIQHSEINFKLYLPMGRQFLRLKKSLDYDFFVVGYFGFVSNMEIGETTYVGILLNMEIAVSNKNLIQ